MEGYASVDDRSLKGGPHGDVEETVLEVDAALEETSRLDEVIGLIILTHQHPRITAKRIQLANDVKTSPCHVRSITLLLRSHPGFVLVPMLSAQGWVHRDVILLYSLFRSRLGSGHFPHGCGLPPRHRGTAERQSGDRA